MIDDCKEFFIIRANRWLIFSWIILLGNITQGEENKPRDDLNLEAHGFVSFGYLKSWGNNWLGETRDGTSEFWESGMNITARPLDRLRLGAQLFARDLVNYDNGKPQLDLLYADYRFADEIGIQAGRIKIPIGLFNESLDTDASRASIFQPPGIYALRARDLYISTNGGKAYGLIGAFEYALFLGNKKYDPDGGVTTAFRQTSIPLQIDRLSAAWMAGGMLHWNTPVSGLATRLTLTEVNDVTINGHLPGYSASSTTNIDNYWWLVASVLYETKSFSWAAEYIRYRGHGETHFSPAIIPDQQTNDDNEGAYISSTWHAKNWLELYIAGEESVTKPNDRSLEYVYTAVLAMNLMPLSNWSIKAEFRDNHGTKGAYAFDNPEGLERRWQVLALKTTVDF